MNAAGSRSDSGGKWSPCDLALEHQVAALRVERVHAAQHDLAVGLLVGEQVGEAGAVLGRELVAERAELPGLDARDGRAPVGRRGAPARRCRALAARS